MTETSIGVFHSEDRDGDELYVRRAHTHEGGPTLLFTAAGGNRSRASWLTIGDVERLHDALGKWLEDNRTPVPKDPEHAPAPGLTREDVCTVVAGAFAALTSHADHMAHLAGPFAHPVYDGIARLAIRTANDPTWQRETETKDGDQTGE